MDASIDLRRASTSFWSVPPLVSNPFQKNLPALPLCHSMSGKNTHLAVFILDDVCAGEHCRGISHSLGYAHGRHERGRQAQANHGDSLQDTKAVLPGERLLAKRGRQDMQGKGKNNEGIGKEKENEGMASRRR